MKIKTSELTGVALDWAVASIEFPNDTQVLEPSRWGYVPYGFATDWAQGGQIVEREKISIRQWVNVPIVHAYMPLEDAEWSSDAESPLIAVMRCYVASKLGELVDIPDELVKKEI